jgi:hypothetical protein
VLTHVATPEIATIEATTINPIIILYSVISVPFSSFNNFAYFSFIFEEVLLSDQNEIMQFECHFYNYLFFLIFF